MNFPEESKNTINTMRIIGCIVAAFILIVAMLIGIAWGVYLFFFNSTPLPQEAYIYMEELLETRQSRLTPIYMILYLKTRNSSFAPTKKEMHIVKQIFECLDESEQLMVIENTHSEIALLSRTLQSLQKKRSNVMAFFSSTKTGGSSNGSSSGSSSSSSK